MIWLIAGPFLAAVRAQEVNNTELSATSQTVVNAAAAAPTVRTASGIVRGVTEGDVAK